MLKPNLVIKVLQISLVNEWYMKLLVRKLGIDDLITLLEDNLIDHVDCDL